ncbi:hypothetical protein EBS40_07995 [bacterium]|nr:hypothetical protein [bacterium]
MTSLIYSKYKNESKFTPVTICLVVLLLSSCSVQTKYIMDYLDSRDKSKLEVSKDATKDCTPE